MSFKVFDWGIRACACVAIAGTVACSSPSSPSATAGPASSSTPAPVGAVTGIVQITVTPNPVVFSGAPITDAAACAGSPNTWFYMQNLSESGGSAVTLVSRIDTFDQRIVNNVTNLNLVVPAMGSLAISSRWCSSAAVAHTAQSSFFGTDANGHTIKVDGPVVTLKSP